MVNNGKREAAHKLGGVADLPNSRHSWLTLPMENLQRVRMIMKQQAEAKKQRAELTLATSMAIRTRRGHLASLDIEEDRVEISRKRKSRCAKVRYRDQGEAEKALHRVLLKKERFEFEGLSTHRFEQRYYECPVCNGMHLTSLPQGQIRVSQIAA